jgi:hypothetical protein
MEAGNVYLSTTDVSRSKSSPEHEAVPSA